jgi:hypothetical protein
MNAAKMNKQYKMSKSEHFDMATTIYIYSQEYGAWLYYRVVLTPWNSDNE